MESGAKNQTTGVGSVVPGVETVTGRGMAARSTGAASGATGAQSATVAETEKKPENKKKLSGGAIAGIVMSAVVVMVAIVIGVLSGTGVIRWSEIFGGSSESGGSGGISLGIPAMVNSQRETQRRHDLAMMNVMIVDYAVDHGGQLPAVEGEDEIYVNGYVRGDTAWDDFYWDYLAKTGEFVDPSGDPYMLKIIPAPTDYLFENEYALLNYQSDEIAVIYGAQCVDDGIERSDRDQAYALVMTTLDGHSIICMTNY